MAARRCRCCLCSRLWPARFRRLCYAQFAATIPVSGSAYTYAYASFGELAAWIIGWALIMEYAVGNIVVAISWSDYFTGLLTAWGWTFRLTSASAFRALIRATTR